MSHPIRIAFWSGPRNLSTALMRSWGSRADTVVCDEPFYAHYLAQTEATWHPGYEETLARHETDYRRVVQWLTGPVPGGAAIFYQKQMAHHVLPGMDLAWIDDLRHGFLIREPKATLLSMAKVFERIDVSATGLPQQAALYERLVGRPGPPPPIVDASDVLMDPRGTLRRLCESLDVPFAEAMLRWAPGPRPTDGAWAPYFYQNVYRSTGFAKPTTPPPDALPAEYAPLLAECEPIYRELYKQRRLSDE